MMLAQLQQITKQAGLLSKCLIGGVRTGSLAQNAFAQLKPLRCYQSDALTRSHIIAQNFHATGSLIGPNFGRFINSQVRCFHAKGSKVQYLDFRYRFNTCHLRSHLLIIRRQKMKKHQKRKWRKKYKSVIAKLRLKREIAKEKTFRVELLTMIRKAEQFDPREYALKKIREINSKPKELTREERLEQLKQLIRENRYQVDYVKPKHKRVEV